MQPLKRRKLNDPSSGATVLDSFQQPSRIIKAQPSVSRDNGLMTASDEHNAVAQSSSADLQKEYASLGRQLTTLRHHLDTAQQARLIEMNDQSNQIKVLIAKWRQIVRDVAEALFEISKASAIFQNEASAAQELPYWQQEQLEAMSEEQRELLELQMEDSRREAEKYGILDTAEQAGTSLSSVSEFLFASPEPTNTPNSGLSRLM
jgi:hypothetical protein